MSNDPTHRKDFVLPDGGHYFIQQFDEWDTNHFRLGQEYRVDDVAFDLSSHITVAVDDAPDLMDQIADYHELPRYTDLLDKVRLLQAMVDRAEKNPRKPNGEVYFDGFGDGFKAGIRAIEIILKGK